MHGPFAWLFSSVNARFVNTCGVWISIGSYMNAELPPRIMLTTSYSAHLKLFTSRLLQVYTLSADELLYVLRLNTRRAPPPALCV